MFVRVVPLGIVHEKVLDSVCLALRETFGAKCKHFTGVPLPEGSMNRWRKQHDAEFILDKIKDDPSVKFIDTSIPTLILTEEDLYYKAMNFIFGIEEPDRGICLISLKRLRPEFYDQKNNPIVLAERIEKEAIHSIGHYLGLKHCRYGWCVMYPSGSVNDIDKKKKQFCNNCELKLTMKGTKLV